jgi:hypothetical protein
VITYNRLEKVIEIARVAGKFDETALFKGENANVGRHLGDHLLVTVDAPHAGLERGD